MTGDHDPLDALQAADEARTPGPWRSRVATGVTIETHAVVAYNEPVILGARPEDAHFIALCGTHVPTLLARLRAAEAVVERAWHGEQRGPECGSCDVGLARWPCTCNGMDQALAKYREVAG